MLPHPISDPIKIFNWRYAHVLSSFGALFDLRWPRSTAEAKSGSSAFGGATTLILANSVWTVGQHTTPTAPTAPTMKKSGYTSPFAVKKEKIADDKK